MSINIRIYIEEMKIENGIFQGQRKSWRNWVIFSELICEQNNSYKNKLIKRYIIITKIGGIKENILSPITQRTYKNDK